MRRDFEIRKELYLKQGLAVLQEYEKIPYISVPFDDLILTEKAVEQSKLLNTAVPEKLEFIWRRFSDAVVHLPFFSVVFEYHTSDTTVHLTTRGVHKINDMGEEGIDLVVYSKRGNKIVNLWLQCALDWKLNKPGDELADIFPLIGCNREIPREQLIMHAADTLNSFCACIEVINISNKHFVEVQPTVRGAAVQSKKPWTRQDLPRIILLDPTQAKLYGHRTETRGTHASPIPHQRRGHWATLRSEKWTHMKGKRVWRKPAWVGDQDWVFKGNQYKVIHTKIPESQIELEIAEDGNESGIQATL